MTDAALAGAHVATLPFKVFQQMTRHPLTDKGIVQFRKDWEAAREALAAKKKELGEINAKKAVAAPAKAAGKKEAAAAK